MVALVVKCGGALLLNVSFVVAHRFGSLRASFVEVRVGGGCSRNVNVGAEDDFGLSIGFKKGGRGLLLRLLVGIGEIKANGGHGWGWVAAVNGASDAGEPLKNLCALCCWGSSCEKF